MDDREIEIHDETTKVYTEENIPPKNPYKKVAILSLLLLVIGLSFFLLLNFIQTGKIESLLDNLPLLSPNESLRDKILPIENAPNESLKDKILPIENSPNDPLKDKILSIETPPNDHLKDKILSIETPPNDHLKDKILSIETPPNAHLKDNILSIENSPAQSSIPPSPNSETLSLDAPKQNQKIALLESELQNQAKKIQTLEAHLSQILLTLPSKNTTQQPAKETVITEGILQALEYQKEHIAFELFIKLPKNNLPPLLLHEHQQISQDIKAYIKSKLELKQQLHSHLTEAEKTLKKISSEQNIEVPHWAQKIQNFILIEKSHSNSFKKNQTDINHYQELIFYLKLALAALESQQKDLFPSYINRINEILETSIHTLPRIEPMDIFDEDALYEFIEALSGQAIP